MMEYVAYCVCCPMLFVGLGWFVGWHCRKIYDND